MLYQLNYRRVLVGPTGFEPATLCSQSRCATKLRYGPTSNPSEALADRVLESIAKYTGERGSGQMGDSDVRDTQRLSRRGSP